MCYNNTIVSERENNTQTHDYNKTNGASKGIKKYLTRLDKYVIISTYSRDEACTHSMLQ